MGGFSATGETPVLAMAMSCRAVLLLIVSLLAGCATTSPQHDIAKVTLSTDTHCLQPATWQRLDSRPAVAETATHILQWASQQDVVLLGEKHSRVDDHRWQLQALAALHVLQPHMVIGFESFPRRLQPVLDQWVAGTLSVDDFLRQTQWQKVWDYPAKFYLPLFQFARMNRIPMIALNVDLSLPRAVRKQGWDAVPVEEREGVSRPAQPSQAYVDMLYDVFKRHAFNDDDRETVGKNAPRFRHFVQAQTTWDRAMAQALAAQVHAGNQTQTTLVVGIMGAGHMRHGHGVPYQLRDLGVDDVAVLLPVTSERACRPFRPGFADAIFVLPGYPDNEPPRLGVQLMAIHGTIVVAGVRDGSVAASAGFEHGDQITAIDGSPVDDVNAVVADIDRQPPGMPLPVTIRRGDKTLRLVVKFPAKQ